MEKRKGRRIPRATKVWIFFKSHLIMNIPLTVDHFQSSLLGGVILLHDGSRLLVSHGLAAASFASLEVALMCLPIADHGLQFACVFLYFIWLLADEAFVKWLDYDIGVLIIRVIAYANNLLLISGAARSDIVFRLPSIPINSIAAVRSVDARGSDLLLLLLLFGEEDVLSEVPSSRISSVWVEIFRLQVRHDVRFRG